MTGDDWVYPDCVGYTLATVQRIASDCGLACCPVAWSNQNHQEWVLFYHPENEPAIPRLDDIAYLQSRGSQLRGQLESSARYSSVIGEYVACKQELMDLERNAYVRVGLGVQALVRRVMRRARGW